MKAIGCLLVRFDPLNRFFHMVVRLVNVTQRALLQALCKLVVLFPRNILMRPVQKLQRTMQPSGPIHPGVHWRVIVQVLSVIDRSLLDLFDGVIDIMDGVFFFVA